MSAAVFCAKSSASESTSTSSLILVMVMMGGLGFGFSFFFCTATCWRLTRRASRLATSSFSFSLFSWK